MNREVKIMKRFFAKILIISMFVLTVNAKSETTLTFTVSDVTVASGKSVLVPITVSGNPGIAMLRVNVTLGEGLEWDYNPDNYTANRDTWPFVGSNDAYVLELSSTRPQGDNLTSSFASLLFTGTGGNTFGNGTLVILKLKVGENASGELPISINIATCLSETGESVNFHPVNPGIIAVSCNCGICEEVCNPIFYHCTCALVCETCDGCRTCRNALGAAVNVRVANASTGAPTPAAACKCSDSACVACVCHVLGDVNGNGIIEILDAVAVLQAFARIPTSLVIVASNRTPVPNHAPRRAAQITQNSIDKNEVAILDAVAVLQGFARISNAIADGSIDGRRK